MGTLTAHIVPGLLLILLAISHLLRSISAYSKSPRDFSAKLLLQIPLARLRHLHLYLLLLAFISFIAYQLIVSVDLPSLLQLGSPILKLIDVQRLLMLLAFLLATFLILLSQTSSALPLPQEAPFILASVCFGVQYMVLSREYVQDLGLEGKCDSLLAALAFACSAFCLLLAWKPGVFVVEVLLWDGVMLQGTWLVQSGLSLYVGRFMPQGCGKMLHLPAGIDGSTRCELEESRARAFALMDLLFICHLLGVMVLTSAVCCAVGRLRRGAAGYEVVSDVEGGSGGVQMKAMPKQAQF